MADTGSGAKNGLTRGKAITIGVLAVVLVTVLYLQYGPSGETATTETSTYRPPRPVVPAVAQQPTPAAAVKQQPQVTSVQHVAAAVFDEARWKSPTLAAVVDYDPFALPAAFPQPQAIDAHGATSDQLTAEAAEAGRKRMAEAAAQQQMEWQELKQRGVNVIVRQHNEFVAVIGDQTLHVGDEIMGYTVTKIDSQGVEVKRMPLQ